MKTCTKCGVDKPFTDFYRNQSRPEGLCVWCKPCMRASAKKWKQGNPEACRAHSRTAYQRHRVDRDAKTRAWVAANPERRKEIANAHARRAYLKDPTRANERRGWRRELEHSRTPSWADRDLIADLYRLARAYTKAGHPAHVDHIVPLQSSLVCGLHVQDNLTVVPASENIAKGNRRWPNMP